MKKMLQNKRLLIFLGIVDISGLVFLIIFTRSYRWIPIFLIIHFVLLGTILKLAFKVNIINFNKLSNYIKCLIKRRKLTDKELYLKKLKVNTFDGSGGFTHPCILYFSDGFNGYKYWMVYTPYDDNNVELENPCIVVSQDGVNFTKPKGIKDPLLPIIQKSKPLTFYNDPCFLYRDNHLEIWYRYTVEGDTLVNDVFRITSNDGINWSEPELMIKSDGECYMSLSIVKIKNIYYMYYFDMDYGFNLKKSKDLYNWSEKERVIVKDLNKPFWHGEVKLINDKLYLLLMSKDYKLYFVETTANDYLNFYDCCELDLNYYDDFYLYGNVILYKSTFLLDQDFISIYVPFRVNSIRKFKLRKVLHRKWTVTLTKLRKNNFNKICKRSMMK